MNDLDKLLHSAHAARDPETKAKLWGEYNRRVAQGEGTLTETIEEDRYVTPSLSIEELRDQSAFLLGNGEPITLIELRSRLKFRYLISGQGCIYLDEEVPILLFARMIFVGEVQFILSGSTIRLLLP